MSSASELSRASGSESHTQIRLKAARLGVGGGASHTTSHGNFCSNQRRT